MLRTVGRNPQIHQNHILDQVTIGEVDFSKSYAYYCMSGDFYFESEVIANDPDDCNVSLFNRQRGTIWAGRMKSESVLCWLMELGMDIEDCVWWSAPILLKSNQSDDKPQRVFKPIRQEVYVYFILNKAVNKVKIGVSIYPGARLAQLQTGLPDKLTLIGSMVGDRYKEKELHERFAHLHCHGEWFDYQHELKEYIREVLTTEQTEEQVTE